MQTITATFITDSGRANGLSPIINISTSGAVIETGVMTGLDLFGNYSYEFATYDKTKLYFFNIDADDADVNNRYKVDNNELDYYQNKADWGNQLRGALSNIDVNISKTVAKEIKKLLTKEITDKLDILKPQDLTELKTILEEIKLKKNDNSEIIDKLECLEDKDDKPAIKKEFTKVISALKLNNSNLTKDNERNYELIVNLTKQTETQGEMIAKLTEYIEKLLKRGNITKDRDFKKLMKDIEGVDRFEKAMLVNDENFILLRNKGV